MVERKERPGWLLVGILSGQVHVAQQLGMTRLRSFPASRGLIGRGLDRWYGIRGHCTVLIGPKHSKEGDLGT